MSNKTRIFFLSLMVITVMLISAVGPTPVYADGETPTDPPVTDTSGVGSNPVGTVTIPPPDGNTVDISTPVPNADEVLPTDMPPTEIVVDMNTPVSPPTDAATDPLPTDAVVDQPITAPTPNITAQVPDNTTVTVINSDGTQEPLATQDAANAIATTSDPIWCPAGQSPTPGANGCTTSFTSFTALLTFLKTNEGNAAYQQAGAIYVQMGNYNGGESNIDFNSYNFNNLQNYDLTVQGGWDTSGSTINNATGTSFTAAITIGTSSSPWAGSLTFNDIQIQNINNHTALTAYSQSDINLSNIQINNIKNGNGATLSTTNGDVTISGGQFNNSTIGADISTGGNVTIKDDAQFKNNKKAGAVIKAGENVNISDSTFSNNGLDNKKGAEGKGVDITSGANVSLFNVYANQNHKFGANVQAAGNVSISSSFFSGNEGYTYSSCGGSTTSGGYGLQVVTVNGISIYQVTASDNYLIGASLTGSDVSISTSTFDNNGSSSNQNPIDSGLYVNSTGGASLYAVEANNNQHFGANIQAKGDVSIASSFFSGNQAYYTYSRHGRTAKDGYGLQVVTTGRVSLDQVTASNNYLYGASLTGSDISISTSTFDNNGSSSNQNPIDSGLYVNSTGGASLYAVEANNNQHFGANIQAKGDVSIANSFFSGNQAYYTYSCHGITAKDGYGLQVVTTGRISLDQVTASDNDLYGASLTGSDVSISTSTFDNNGSSSNQNPIDSGLYVNSTGGASLYAVEANNNQHFGANIQAKGDVSIASSFFSGNQAYYTYSCHGITAKDGYGLQIVTTGRVSLDQVTASNNDSTGAILNNKSDVVVTQSTFNNNGTQIKASGLSITTSGQVTLTNVTAINNSLDGVDVTGICTNNVYVIDGTYSDNNKYGIKIINANLFLSGSPIFTNNHAGNIFQNSSACFGNNTGGSHHDDSHGSHHDHSDHSKHSNHGGHGDDRDHKIGGRHCR